jgi:hypothetical protein
MVMVWILLWPCSSAPHDGDEREQQLAKNKPPQVVPPVGTVLAARGQSRLSGRFAQQRRRPHERRPETGQRVLAEPAGTTGRGAPERVGPQAAQTAEGLSRIKQSRRNDKQSIILRKSYLSLVDDSSARHPSREGCHSRHSPRRERSTGRPGPFGAIPVHVLLSFLFQRRHAGLTHPPQAGLVTG